MIGGGYTAPFFVFQAGLDGVRSRYPIVGDKLYGRDETAFLKFIEHGLTNELEKQLVLPRCALHAAKLVFLHPFSREEMVIRAPLPKMFVKFIANQRMLEA